MSLNVRGDVSCTTNCDRKCRESLTDLRFDEKKADECTPLKLLFLSLSFEIHQAFHEGRFDTFVSIGKIIFEKYAWLFELILIRGRKLYRSHKLGNSETQYIVQWRWKNYFGKYVQTWKHNCTKAIDRDGKYVRKNYIIVIEIAKRKIIDRNKYFH